MTVLPASPSRDDPRGVATSSAASRFWRGFGRGFAEMGALGMGRRRMRRAARSDAEALAGDWRRVLSGLDQALRHARPDGRP